MKYIIAIFISLTALGANARVRCSASCSLIGNDVNETQSVYYFDGFLYQYFSLESFKGHKVSGAFKVDGDPNTTCGSLSSVWVSVDNSTYGWQDNEVIFSFDGDLYKFTCEYHGVTFY